MKDAKGKITSYVYDAFGRLQMIKDANGNILKKFCYGYKGQPTACP